MTASPRNVRRSPFPPLLARWGAALLAVSLSAGCASTSSPGPADPSVPRDMAELVRYEEEHALLLLMADRRLFEPLAVAEAFQGDEALRVELALVLGRLGDVRGIPPLERLLGAESKAVRRAAAFGLGELGEKGHEQVRSALEGALLDADRDVGRRAVEALWKAGVELEDLVAKLIEGEPDELLPRLLPSLFRFDSPRVVHWAEQGLERAATTGDDALRRQAAYALARSQIHRPQPEAAPLLRSILDDEDPWIRGWAARGLGQVGDRFDLERLEPLLEDAAEGPVIQALRAGKRLVEAGDAPPPDAWRPHLLRLLADARPGVRVTAIEASSSWLLDDDLAAPLLALGREGEIRERELALLALAEGEDDRALVLLPTAASDPNPSVRAAAVRAAGLLGDVERIARMLLDESPEVRRAAVDTLLLAEPPDPMELLRRALADPDPTVRSLALDWGGDRGLFDVETLHAAWRDAQRDRLPDARLEAVRALAVLALAQPEDGADAAFETRRRAAVERLQRIAREADWGIRREAITALRAAGVQAPALGAVDTGMNLENYRDVVRRTRTPKLFDVETAKGTFTLELDCPSARMTCLSFEQLATQGFYDGLTWHRVVPDFVVQGGDPRGDGQGGPGYTLRDETGLMRFTDHVVGMAHSGPETAGSQFFVTLSAQPHLDGAYTAFGRVVAGAEVLHRLLEHDPIVRIRERSVPAN